MRRTLLLGVVCLFGLSAIAQQDPVLMRINGKAVTRSEFETSFHKQKSLVGSDASTPVGYIDPFVNFKLKVCAAESAGLDTTHAFRKKLDDYRIGLATPYLLNNASEEAESRLAYDRMKASPRSGQVQVMQFFIPLSQTISATQIRAAEAKMDSAYATLKGATDTEFAAYVEKYSGDKTKCWISRLQTPEEFENIVFSLKEGEVSSPFYTPQGLHIVKVFGQKEMLPLSEILAEKRRRLSSLQRLDKSTEALVGKLKSEYAYTPDALGVEELLNKGATTRSLFTLNGRAYSGTEFKRFAASYPRSLQTQLDAFVAKAVLDMENSRLEQKNPEVRLLVQLYRDSLLLSQITAHEVGTKAVTDVAGLSTYFKLHRSDYNWKRPRYRGVVLHSVDKKSLRQAKKTVRKLPQDQWADAIRQALNTPSQENVKIVQGLFAEGDNKYVDKLVFKKGTFEPVMSYPFTAVLGEKQKGPDSYKEVRKQLSADYKSFLDLLWTKQLRAAAKVEINQEVLKTVNNH